MTPEEQKKYEYTMARLAKWESLGIRFEDANELLDKSTHQCEVCEAYKRAEAATEKYLTLAEQTYVLEYKYKLLNDKFNEYRKKKNKQIQKLKNK